MRTALPSTGVSGTLTIRLASGSKLSEPGCASPGPWSSRLAPVELSAPLFTAVVVPKLGGTVKDLANRCEPSGAGRETVRHDLRISALRAQGDKGWRKLVR